MKQFLKFTIPLSIALINAGQALALPARTVYSKDAQGINSNGVELRIWKGYGVTVNFMSTGEVIKQVWIGDPSRISFTSNGNLCPKDNSQDCNGGATVIFLRQIQPISFPHLTSSKDGSTQITILTSGSEGQKQYQFKLIPAAGQPQYTSLIIRPDSERPAPLLLTSKKTVPAIRTTVQKKVNPVVPAASDESVSKPTGQQQKLTEPVTPESVSSRNVEPTNTETAVIKPMDRESTATESVVSELKNPEPTTPESVNKPTGQQQKLTEPENPEIATVTTTDKPIPSGSLQRDDANALVYGLTIARQKGHINPGSSTWRKVQDAIKLLRRGKSRQEAISSSGVSDQVFNQLIEWGKTQ